MNKSMRHLIFLIPVWLIFCQPAAADVDFTKVEGEWEPLFNGKDLDGWVPKVVGSPAGENVGDVFRVEDGKLCVAYDQWKTYEQRPGHLIHRGTYSHYLLRARYRFVGEQLDDGENPVAWHRELGRNNGLMLHCQSADTMQIHQRWPVSFEVQLLGGFATGEPRQTANICTLGMSCILEDGSRQTGRFPSCSETYFGDQWVEAVVVVRGDRLVQHYINGRLVSSCTGLQLNPVNPINAKAIREAPNQLSRGEGQIGIQAESGPTQFESIDVLRLQPDTILPLKPILNVESTKPKQVATGFQRARALLATADNDVLLLDDDALLHFDLDRQQAEQVDSAAQRTLRSIRKEGPLASYFQSLNGIPRRAKRVLVLHTELLDQPLDAFFNICRSQHGGYWFIQTESGGVAHRKGKSQVVSDVDFPALAIRPSRDQSQMFVASANAVFRFDIQTDGRLTNKFRFHEFRSGAKFSGDRIISDIDDNIYFVHTQGIDVVTQAGKRLHKIELPDAPTSCCFAGPLNSTLFVTTGNALYAQEMNVRGPRAILESHTFRMYTFLNPRYAPAK